MAEVSQMRKVTGFGDVYRELSLNPHIWGTNAPKITSKPLYMVVAQKSGLKTSNPRKGTETYAPMSAALPEGVV